MSPITGYIWFQVKVVYEMLRREEEFSSSPFGEISIALDVEFVCLPFKIYRR